MHTSNTQHVIPGRIMVLCDARILCFGTDALKLYSEIHQSPVNQIIHGLGMPFVGYAVFMWVPLILYRLYNYMVQDLSTTIPIWVLNIRTIPVLLFNIRFALYILYVTYYFCFDPVGAIVTQLIYLVPFYLATKRIHHDANVHEHSSSLIVQNIGIMALSIFVQEGIGHAFFEHVNSDLWQLPNSISIAPLFGTRALLHNFLGFRLIPA